MTSRAKGHKLGQPIRFINGHNARGSRHSVETKAKIGAASAARRHTVETRRRLAGPNRPLWKGNAVAYKTLHAWVGRHKVKAGACSECGAAGATEWANVSGQYRRDLDDFTELCRSCHRRFDKGR